MKAGAEEEEQASMLESLKVGLGLMLEAEMEKKSELKSEKVKPGLPSLKKGSLFEI